MDCYYLIFKGECLEYSVFIVNYDFLFCMVVRCIIGKINSDVGKVFFCILMVYGYVG